MNTMRRRRTWPTGFGHGYTAVVWTLAGIFLVSACEPSEGRGQEPPPPTVRKKEAADKTTDSGPSCRALEEQLTELRDERDSLKSQRDEARDRLADLEKATEQLEAFEPKLEPTSIHIFPSRDPPPREVGGLIRNGTDQTVAVAHLDATFIPSDPEGDPVEREVVYELRKPLAGGEVDHGPYGQQILDAFHNIETEIWRQGKLDLEVTALEGPNGKVLWDRRGRDPEALAERLEDLQAQIEDLDERIATKKSRLADLREERDSCP
ncbi:MAG: hypothetical protein ABEN55_08315 [Bradymonadaceae bacterium]